MDTWISKRDIASGLVVLLPILLTIWVVIWLYNFISGVPLISRIIRPELFGGNILLAELARVIVTLVVFGLLVVLTGTVMRTALGRVIEAMIDDTMNHVPGLRVVYNASKVAIDTALSGGADLQRPVKIEPWNGMRLTAFKTGNRTSDGREIVFMPTSPNITSGFVIEVEDDDIIETDERVEDALTRVLSAGFGENEREVQINVIDATDPTLNEPGDNQPRKRDQPADT